MSAKSDYELGYDMATAHYIQQLDALSAQVARLQAAAQGRGMPSELDGPEEVAVLIDGLYARAEKAEAERDALVRILTLIKDIGLEGGWHMASDALNPEPPKEEE